MRKVLIAALILYNFTVQTSRPGPNYDYEDLEANNKRHSIMEERRNWRKKSLLKPMEERKDWDRWRHEYDNPRYNNMEEQEPKMFNNADRQRDRDRDMEMSSPYRPGGNRHYANENNMQPIVKSAEREPHPSVYNMEKDMEKKQQSMNCERPHERYEGCFAGCASVTCDNPRDRLRPCYPFCEPGCICVHPYVRDDRTHKCVLTEECSKGLKGIPDISDDM